MPDSQATPQQRRVATDNQIIPDPRIAGKRVQTGDLKRITAPALELFFMGLNVTIQPFASKGGGIPWKPVMYNRLTAADLVTVIGKYTHELGTLPNLAVLVGRTSCNLAVIDCETPAAFDYWRAMFQQEGIPLRTVKTAKGGHLYLRVIDGPIQSIPASQITGDHAGEYEIRGENGYVLAPPSVHPTGVVYQWTDSGDIPQLTVEQLRDLGLPAQATRPRRRGDTPQQSPNQTQGGPFDGYNLSNRTRRFLQQGAPNGSRNNELFRAACDCAGCGVPIGQGRDWLLAAALMCGEDERKARDTIDRAYRNADTGSREYYGMAATTAPRVIPDWQRADRWIQAQQWTGRTGPSTRAVAVALAERARVGGSGGLFRASVRELVELARCRIETALRALERLQDRGYVVKAGADRSSGAGLWRFGPAVAAAGTPSGFAPVGPQRSPTGAIDPDGRGRQSQDGQRGESGSLPPTGKIDSDPVSHLSSRTDAAERGALGPVAVLVYREITLRPARTQAEIAARCGLSGDQVKRALAKLRALAPEGAPLVTYTRAGGYVGHERSDEWLDEHIAAPAGKAGAADRRRAKHEQQRSARARNAILDAIVILAGGRVPKRAPKPGRRPYPQGRRARGNPDLDGQRVPRGESQANPSGPPGG